MTFLAIQIPAPVTNAKRSSRAINLRRLRRLFGEAADSSLTALRLTRPPSAASRDVFFQLSGTL